MLVALLAPLALAGELLYQEPVAYQENHDPSVIALQGGPTLEVKYGAIPWEEVDAWAPGRLLTFGYDPERGTVLVDPASGRALPVLALDGLEHPLDQLTAQCLERDGTTVGMVNCYQAATANWDLELNRVYQSLMATLTPESQETLRASQRAWIAFRDAQMISLGRIYGEREGTMWSIVAAAEITDLTKTQALRLQGYQAW